MLGLLRSRNAEGRTDTSTTEFLALTAALPYRTCAEQSNRSESKLGQAVIAANAAAGAPTMDVRSVRRKRGLTQQAFADTFGFTVGAVRDWEQGRKRPDRAARVLLAVIQTSPEVVADAVARVRRHGA